MPPRAAPQRETQRRLFGSLAPQATGNGTSAVHPPGVGPRLEAFNMAKSGAPRDEVARHLKEVRTRGSQEILNDAFLRSGR